MRRWCWAKVSFSWPAQKHLPSPRASLGSCAPVSPNHRHKRLLPNWFVSLSIKPQGYCCPPHLPLPENAFWLPQFLHFQFSERYLHSTNKKLEILDAFFFFFPSHHWGILILMKKKERNETQLSNLNEAQCTLLFMLNSQVAKPEVIQSSCPAYSEWYLVHLSYKSKKKKKESEVEGRKKCLLTGEMCGLMCRSI